MAASTIYQPPLIGENKFYLSRQLLTERFGEHWHRMFIFTKLFFELAIVDLNRKIILVNFVWQN